MELILQRDGVAGKNQAWTSYGKGGDVAEFADTVAWLTPSQYTRGRWQDHQRLWRAFGRRLPLDFHVGAFAS
jgi:hypothetical protein